jgi:oligopeptide/dipeptide ABC transporter ATP-binding protein
MATTARNPCARGPLLEVNGLKVQFNIGRGRPPVRAVDGVDLAIAPGETLGLVGESGSGKTTIGRAVLGLTPVTEGTIDFDGADITNAGHRQRRALSSELQVVFQDPYSSLNPTSTVGQTLTETLRVHDRPSDSGARRKVEEMLRKIGLGPDAANRFPSQFSGGQRQRIAIARALMVRPRLVICDEPVSALDLSVQAQVLNLLRQLQDEFQLSYLFVGHDLAVVRYLSHRMIVLYRGRIMEQGDAATVYHDPVHPYTQALLEAAPVPDPDEQERRRGARAERRVLARDEVGSRGCPFAARCPHAVDRCWEEQPQLETTTTGSLVACHRWRAIRENKSGAAASMDEARRSAAGSAR